MFINVEIPHRNSSRGSSGGGEEEEERTGVGWSVRNEESITGDDALGRLTWTETAQN